MLSELDAEVKQARKAVGLSLDVASQAAGVSNAYLHKLEAGGVNSPSPRMLARVALALKVPYLRLMELAGYLDEDQLIAAQKRSPQPHPLANRGLTPQQWAKVGLFIDQLLQDSD